MWQVTLDLLPCAQGFIQDYELGLPSVWRIGPGKRGDAGSLLQLLLAL